MVIVWMLLVAIRVGLSVWALLDAARRPAWAWSLAERSQLFWVAASVFSLLLSFPGMAIALWYLVRVRPAIAAVESGNLSKLS